MSYIEDDGFILEGHTGKKYPFTMESVLKLLNDKENEILDVQGILIELFDKYSKKREEELGHSMLIGSVYNSKLSVIDEAIGLIMKE